MAAIDKIYGNRGQYRELYKFLEKHNPGALQYLYAEPLEEGIESPLSNFPQSVDFWLMMNCPLDFIRERLAEQYNVEVEETGC